MKIRHYVELWTEHTEMHSKQIIRIYPYTTTHANDVQPKGAQQLAIRCRYHDKTYSITDENPKWKMPYRSITRWLEEEMQN